MESSYQARKLIQYLLLVFTLLILAWGVWAQVSSHIVRKLISHEDTRISVAVFTEPAMQFSYNPATRKAVTVVADSKCSTQHKETCFGGNFDLFFIPKHSAQQPFWDGFKYTLDTWRFNPLLMANVFGMYVDAWHDNRTNIRPAEFLLLVQNLAALDITDFAIKYPAATPRKKKNKTAAAPDIPAEKILAQTTQTDDKPLVLEILNATGEKGLALKLTQYLREQNMNGKLRVDVIDYGNYPTVEKKSSIIDYSGRLAAVTQVSRALGIVSEIKAETSPTAICDTRIILGKDFQMPL